MSVIHRQAAGCERAHTHSSFIFSAISRGEMLFQINENEFTLRPPSIVVVSTNTLHNK
ncbi:AraC family ligand binding domain-containing protein [Pseudoalteromonas sp. McH1-7]|uniref:AraC family ligand binding domain-containing protein n=1 Tax=Pseudoalteromonas sp. SCSIO 43201 TaxID=2822842 RepID=UPI001590450C|nr:AraC family ligand binding domain-containing protein [Pseudoalteromonas sp. McH1-7]USD30714.1 AraC family ligand binding domain-containing protein [Pseudoalteromonas sp. SCSIO 43201]